MKVDACDPGYMGKSTWERLCRASSVLLARGRFGGRAWVGPDSFQAVQDELVASHNPTLRAEWDGSHCYLRASVCGRELTVHMREDLADYQFEVSEEPEPALAGLEEFYGGGSAGRTHGEFLMRLARVFDGMARGLRVVTLAFLRERYDERGEKR